MWFKHGVVFTLIHLSCAVNELSQAINTWSTYEGATYEGAWSYDAAAVELTQTYSDQDTTDIYDIIFIKDKQWYNVDGHLSINFTFSATFAGHKDRSFGVSLLNGQARSWCEWYIFYIYLTNNGHQVGLARGNTPDMAESTLQEVPLEFSFIDGNEYTMNINVINDKTFTIAIDNSPYISHTDTEGFTTTNNGYSGYFELWSQKQVILKAKYISISGTRTTVTPIVDSITTNCVSLEPTTATTNPSIYTPTQGPTTQAPTIDPTKDEPSTEPSITPANVPSTDIRLAAVLSPANTNDENEPVLTATMYTFNNDKVYKRKRDDTSSLITTILVILCSVLFFIVMLSLIALIIYRKNQIKEERLVQHVVQMQRVVPISIANECNKGSGSQNDDTLPEATETKKDDKPTNGVERMNIEPLTVEGEFNNGPNEKFEEEQFEEDSIEGMYVENLEPQAMGTQYNIRTTNTVTSKNSSQ